MDVYLRFRAAEGLRGATLTDYRRKIRQSFKTYPDSWRNCVEEPLLEWLAAAKSPATYNLRLGALRLFLDWAVEKQLVPCNPVAGFHMRKKSDRIVEIPKDVIREFLTLPDRKTYVGLRDYAPFTLFVDTGIRPSECFKLPPGDLNFKTHMPKGLGTKIRPYELRHVFALIFLKRGVNAFALQRIMGHESMDMTRRYVNLVQGDIKEMHRAGSPADGLAPRKRKRVDGWLKR